MIAAINPGEIYVGCYSLDGKTLIHFFILPGDNDDDTYEAQMEWAKSIGGDLPNRIEQAMLWVGHRNRFKQDWYWSNEIHHSESDWAWGQGFDYGHQSNYGRAHKLRARAVRRVHVLLEM